MRLNKSTNHAIKILIECARSPDDLIKVADLSARLEMTPHNTFKIVNILSHAGFIDAVRGRYGGVRLAQPAKQIRIGDVVRQIEVGLESERSTATPSDPGISGLVDNAFEAFLQVLDGQTLADMAKGKSRRSNPSRDRTSPSLARNASMKRSQKSAKTASARTPSSWSVRS